LGSLLAELWPALFSTEALPKFDPSAACVTQAPIGSKVNFDVSLSIVAIWSFVLTALAHV
jgi:hypothetical protein